MKSIHENIAYPTFFPSLFVVQLKQKVKGNTILEQNPTGQIFLTSCGSIDVKFKFEYWILLRRIGI